MMNSGDSTTSQYSEGAARTETTGLEAEHSVQRKQPVGSIQFDRVMVALCSWLMGGLYLDGWAHNHVPELETFFTPWHAVLYSGFFAVASFLAIAWLRNRGKGYPWQRALPAGYNPSMLGVLLFLAGGLADMIWHILFGIEVGIEALLSPTHLILALGGSLILSGPLRAAWHRSSGRLSTPSWAAQLPMLLSLTLLLSMFTFFTQYSHLLAQPWVVQQASNLEVHSEIYVMRADGSGQTRLTKNSPREDWNPAQLPNGSKIAFASDFESKSSLESKSEVYVTDTNSNQIQLAHDTADDADAPQSPDGSKKLAKNSQEDWNPTWSPDGNRIAFASGLESKSGFEEIKSEIYVMSADGSNQTKLTDNEAYNAHPIWSPDGSKIAYESNRDQNLEIYIMNADGSGQTNLTHHKADDGSASWSPDGSKIAFNSKRDGNWEIYVMNPDGSGQIKLTDNKADDANASWSPDGSKIIFNSKRDGNWEIYVMDSNGSGQTRLTTNQDDDWSPAWSPNSREITFVSNRDQNFEVYVMNADGSNQTNLTNNPAMEDSRNARPSWSPDGNMIIFESQGHPRSSPVLRQILGITSILLQTGLLMGFVLLAMQRWTLPLGSLTTGLYPQYCSDGQPGR